MSYLLFVILLFLVVGVCVSSCERVSKIGKCVSQQPSLNPSDIAFISPFIFFFIHYRCLLFFPSMSAHRLYSYSRLYIFSPLFPFMVLNNNKQVIVKVYHGGFCFEVTRANRKENGAVKRSMKLNDNSLTLLFCILSGSSFTWAFFFLFHLFHFIHRERKKVKSMNV